MSTRVPAPVPGTINQTVKSHKISVLPKVALTRSVDVATGVAVRIAEIRAVSAVTHVPGQVNGPAIEVTVSITNGTAKALPLNAAEANVSDSKGDPGIPVTTSDTRPFAGSVKPGATTTGVFVFRVPVNRRDPVTVTATCAAAGPVAQFAGPVK